MQYTIAFRSPYKSITALPSITAPPFVVLTGANGSGKSHVLEALKAGHLQTSLTSSPDTEIALYDWNSIIPKDTGAHIPAQEKVRRSNLFVQITNHRQNALTGLQALAAKHGIPAKNFSSWEEIQNLLGPDHLVEILGNTGRAETFNDALRDQLKQAATRVRNETLKSNNDLSKAAQRLFSANPLAFLFDDETSFFHHDPFLWGEVDPFKQAFASLFTTYRSLQRSNLVLVGAKQRGIPGQPPMDEAEFQKTYGRPPWDFVNSILEINKLDFSIDAPNLIDEAAYQPRLTKRSRGVEMKFADLSSGERVLMSFALCLYNSLEKRQTRTFPKLLLLDEVDAPLHPSMVRFLLKTIEETLVRENNVAVILTTHKPTTVGLASDEAVYLMSPDGPAIEKTTKGKALSILTEGVPTMSISFDGRRQVFVESSRDARIYDRLYQRYKPELSSERSLTFISVGHTDAKGQDRNAGCTQVRALVNGLAKAGNQTVLGLVDWDAEQSQTSRVHVLCHARRNGLENLILDPVLVIAALAHHDAQYARDLGFLESDEKFAELSQRSPDLWRKSVNMLVANVLEDEGGLGSKTRVAYLCGMTLEFCELWLTMDDHTLEAKLLSTIHPLNNPKKTHRSLSEYISKVILDEHPKLVPTDLLDTFRELLRVDLNML